MQTRTWADEMMSSLEFAALKSVTQNVFLRSSTHVNWFKSNKRHKIQLIIRQKPDQNYQLHTI